MTIDWPFIERLEGNLLVGYVPEGKDRAPLGNSGVTVGMGVDLGRMSRGDIDALGLPAALRAKLYPYAMARGSFAQRILAVEPLELTNAERDALNEAAGERHTAQLRRIYDASTSPWGRPGFAALPDCCQTVLASVAWQYGDLSGRTPNFWAHVVRQDWPAAIAELRAFGDAYTKRRHAEADYLAAGLSDATQARAMLEHVLAGDAG